MQVVDTNRSKASFKRLNNKHLKEARKKRAKASGAPSREQERNEEINCGLNESLECAVVRVEGSEVRMG